MDIAFGVLGSSEVILGLRSCDLSVISGFGRTAAMVIGGYGEIS